MVRVVLQCYPAEEEGDDAGDAEAVGEEVGCVRDERDEGRLEGREGREGGVFEGEGEEEREGDAEGGGEAEVEEEEPRAV